MGEGDLDENAAAAAVAALLAAPASRSARPYTGAATCTPRARPARRRCRAHRPHQRHRRGVTVATLPQHAAVRAGAVVATVKIIPLAVAASG
jgi:molybdenum cofactor cytidylyltransferase